MSLNDDAVLSFPWNSDFTDAIGLNNGVPVGAIIDTVNKKIGAGSAFFDGINDKINVSDSADLDSTSGLSVSCWVRRLSTGAVHAILSKYNAAGGDQRSYLFRINSNNTVRFQVAETGSGSSIQYIDSVVTITDTSWHHCVGTRDVSTGIKIYVDTVVNSAAATISSIFAGTSDMQIGVSRQIGTDNWKFHGNIDALAEWKNRAITSAEVAQLYNGGAGLEMPVAGVAKNLLLTGVG